MQREKNIEHKKKKKDTCLETFMAGTKDREADAVPHVLYLALAFSFLSQMVVVLAPKDGKRKHTS